MCLGQKLSAFIAWTADGIVRNMVAFVGIHTPILAISGSLLGSTLYEARCLCFTNRLKILQG